MSARPEDYRELVDGIGPHAARFVRSVWPEAVRSFGEKGLHAYLNGAAQLSAAGLGWSVVLVYLRETPAVARIVGAPAALAAVDAALGVYAHAGRQAVERLFVTGPAVSRRLADTQLYREYLDFLRYLAISAPAAVEELLGRVERLLAELSLDGLRRWADVGVQAHARDAESQRRYFTLESEEGRRVLAAEADGTLLTDVERRLGLYLRALWGRNIELRPLLHAQSAAAESRASFDRLTIRLPQTFRGFAGKSGIALYRAAAAHAAAHIVFTPQRFPVGTLKPLQIALVSLIEDARVEQLAIRQFPGLRRLWSAFHVAQTGAAATFSLLARLSHALFDAQYVDDDPWVRKGRGLFYEQQLHWEDPAISRLLGGLLGNDIGQMRVPFDFRTYVVEPAYRDDNQGIWDFGVAGRPAHPDDDIVMQGAPPTSGDAVPESGQPDRNVGAPPGKRAPVRSAPAGTRDEQARDEPLSSPVCYDEWDYLIGRDRTAWCTVLERTVDEGSPRVIDEVLDRNADLVNRVKTLVRAVQVHRPTRRKRRLEGDRLDLDAGIAAAIDLRMRLVPDPRVYTVVGRQMRDLAVLVLLDLSQSTNDIVRNAGTSVLALARDATALLADAMDRIGDSFAVHGFCSNGRHEVSYFRFKDFDRPYADRAKARLAGMSGQLSTRMGAALRHAGRHMDARRAHRKLILLVTDGEPSDVDVHDPQYLMFDAKRAVEQNTRRGILTYCLSLDPKADRYVSRIFGMRNYTVMDHLRRLPEKLPFLYMRLTH